MREKLIGEGWYPPPDNIRYIACVPLDSKDYDTLYILPFTTPKGLVCRKFKDDYRVVYETNLPTILVSPDKFTNSKDCMEYLLDLCCDMVEGRSGYGVQDWIDRYPYFATYKILDNDHSLDNFVFGIKIKGKKNEYN
jgi:hypothetical protein